MNTAPNIILGPTNRLPITIEAAPAFGQAPWPPRLNAPWFCLPTCSPSSSGRGSAKKALLSMLTAKKHSTGPHSLTRDVPARHHHRSARLDLHRHACEPRLQPCELRHARTRRDQSGEGTAGLVAPLPGESASHQVITSHSPRSATTLVRQLITRVTLLQKVWCMVERLFGLRRGCKAPPIGHDACISGPAHLCQLRPSPAAVCYSQHLRHHLWQADAPGQCNTLHRKGG
ncbi:MAG: hypothetical protein JWO89_1911 [Verrucomicrobiaceae bacterium]|nr:hypothetical protein [Verrucomicrobiaceae bacterium]